ncbi:MAG: MFS transporter [Cyanobacteria bacterium Co-bin8]|nr:MFS transporter [Cyanobacteria bacterium Co-bin8]
MTLPRLSLPARLAYGVGELAGAVPVSLAAFFLLYFLTAVVGLSPALAGGVLLLGRVWDAINDPAIGWLSDRTTSPLGRRYPWMVYGAVPLALCCGLLWWVPPISSQSGLFTYYALLSLVVYVAFTAVQLPYTALAAELSDDYDERTSLIGIKSAFSIGGSLLGLGLAQVVFAQVAQPRQQYLVLGLISGGIALVAVTICVVGTYRRYWQMEAQRRERTAALGVPLSSQIRSLWQNSAFRQVLGLYLFAWMGIQVTAAMLPYFVSAWMKLPETHFAQMALTVQGSAIVSMVGWNWLGQRTEKRSIFLTGAPISVLCLLGLVTVQPEQMGWMYGLAAGVGLGLATLYLVPFAMLPDVIDLDELRTGQRREGVYFSAVVFLQKLGLAIALFLSGQVLERTGLTADAVDQPTSALWAIRLLIGPLPALLVAGSLWFAYRYPISRQKHQEIVLALQARRPG